jgi:Serine/threonine protein phosphatase
MPYETARFLDSYRPVDAAEDRAELMPAGDSLVLAVADGVGGQPGGGPAADRAVALVREAVTGEALRPDRPEAWYHLFHTIDAALRDAPDAGQTTLAVVAVTPRRLVGASVGDSGAWWVNPDGYFDLTGGQERKPYLGQGMAQVVPFSLPRPAAGTLLVASDGLFKYAQPDRILDTVTDPAHADDGLDATAKRLADLARLSSGQLLDDVAILLCRRTPDAAAGGWLAGRVRRWLHRGTAATTTLV